MCATRLVIVVLSLLATSKVVGGYPSQWLKNDSKNKNQLCYIPNDYSGTIMGKKPVFNSPDSTCTLESNPPSKYIPSGMYTLKLTTKNQGVTVGVSGGEMLMSIEWTACPHKRETKNVGIYFDTAKSKTFLIVFRAPPANFGTLEFGFVCAGGFGSVVYSNTFQIEEGTPFLPSLPTPILPSPPTVPTFPKPSSSNSPANVHIYSLINQIKGNENMTTFASLLESAGVSDLLDAQQHPGKQFTVFAPSDEAFKKLPDDFMEELMKDEHLKDLQDLLKFHIIGGSLTLFQLQGSKQSVSSDFLTFITQEGLNVIGFDTKALVSETSGGASANGILYGLNEVLIKESVLKSLIGGKLFHDWLFEDPMVSTFASLHTSSSPTPPVPLTLFVPTNEAMSHLPPGTVDKIKQNASDIYLYHFVPEKRLFADLKDNDTLTTLIRCGSKSCTLNVQHSNDGQVFLVGDAGAGIVSSSFTKTNMFTMEIYVHFIDTLLIPNHLLDVLGIKPAIDIAKTMFGSLLFSQLLTDEVRNSLIAGPEKLTFLAPESDAFTKLTTKELALLQNTTTALEILKYHILVGMHTITSLNTDKVLKTKEGSDMLFVKKDSKLVGGSIVAAGLATTETFGLNGVVHSIDSVLIPPSLTENNSPSQNTIKNYLSSNGMFSSVTKMLNQLDLMKMLDDTGQVTFFAPVNTAFDDKMDAKLIEYLLLPANSDLLKDTLQYHLQDFRPFHTTHKNSTYINPCGSILVSTVNNTITAMDDRGKYAEFIQEPVILKNGVVHTINRLLISRKTREHLLMRAASPISIEIGNYSSVMETLLNNAPLPTMNLSSTGKLMYTIFCPTDKAFGKLGSHFLSNLFLNSEQLADLLKFHITYGTRTSTSIVPRVTIKMRLGQYVSIVDSDGQIAVLGGSPGNIAKFKSMDHFALNGVIHVIDTVLLPRNFKLDPFSTNPATVTPTFTPAAISRTTPSRITTPGISLRNITMFSLVSSYSELHKLRTAFYDARLYQLISNGGPYTLFAPVDSAMSRFEEETGFNLRSTKNKGKLHDLLLYHMLYGRYHTQNFVNYDELDTLLANKTIITLVPPEDLGVFLKSDISAVIAAISDADKSCSNGVVHMIDSVLVPPGFFDDETTDSTSRDTPTPTTLETLTWTPVSTSTETSHKSRHSSSSDLDSDIIGLSIGVVLAAGIILVVIFYVNRLRGRQLRGYRHNRADGQDEYFTNPAFGQDRNSEDSVQIIGLHANRDVSI
eukprot:m.33051 g.33051  ORF g.33051 m.33051 type:complete len:1243 (+) comp8483_c0_seq1:293-4021(+)